MKTAWLAALAAVTMVAPVTTGAAIAQRGDYRWNGDRDGRWEPADHYREGRYRERRLGRNDRIYRGRDGRAYCRRSDGTTGLVVGAVGGGVLGNLVGRHARHAARCRWRRGTRPLDRPRQREVPLR